MAREDEFDDETLGMFADANFDEEEGPEEEAETEGNEEADEVLRNIRDMIDEYFNGKEGQEDTNEL